VNAVKKARNRDIVMGTMHVELLCKRDRLNATLLAYSYHRMKLPRNCRDLADFATVAEYYSVGR
jgi:hypothetical protein